MDSSYCGWKKSCTTLDGWNMLKPCKYSNGINHLSTGAGFLPSTVSLGKHGKHPLLRLWFHRSGISVPGFAWKIGLQKKSMMDSNHIQSMRFTEKSNRFFISSWIPCTKTWPQKRVVDLKPPVDKKKWGFLSTTVFGTTSRKYETHRGLHLTMFPCFCVHEWSCFFLKHILTCTILW